MVVFGQSGFIRANVVVFGIIWKYSCKVNVFAKKRLNLGKSDCIRAKMVLFGKSGCIAAKWLYSVKSGCIREKLL